MFDLTNEDRFPEDSAFRLTKEEFTNLISQFATSSSKHGGRRKLPLVFTEHGAIMAANVLNSKRAEHSCGYGKCWHQMLPWEDLDTLMRALNVEKTARARAELESIATALESLLS